MFEILQELSGNENKVVSEKLYIDFMDNLQAGMMLSQLIYWSKRTRLKDGWIAKPYTDWWDELRLKRGAAIRAKDKIEAKGIIETKTAKFNGFPTVHYKILHSELIEALVSFRNDGKYRNDTNDSTETERTIDSTETERTITENRLKAESAASTPKEELNMSWNPVQYIIHTLDLAPQITLDRWCMNYRIDPLDLRDQMESFAHWYFMQMSERHGENEASDKIAAMKLRAVSSAFETKFLRNYKEAV